MERREGGRKGRVDDEREGCSMRAGGWIDDLCDFLCECTHCKVKMLCEVSAQKVAHKVNLLIIVIVDCCNAAASVSVIPPLSIMETETLLNKRSEEIYKHCFFGQHTTSTTSFKKLELSLKKRCVCCSWTFELALDARRGC